MPTVSQVPVSTNSLPRSTRGSAGQRDERGDQPLLERIKVRFDQEGITIPVPQRVVLSR